MTPLNLCRSVGLARVSQAVGGRLRGKIPSRNIPTSAFLRVLVCSPFVSFLWSLLWSCQSLLWWNSWFFCEQPNLTLKPSPLTAPPRSLRRAPRSFADTSRFLSEAPRAQATCLWRHRCGRESVRGVLQPERDGGGHPENARKVLRGATIASVGVRRRALCARLARLLIDRVCARSSGWGSRNKILLS